MGQNTHNRRAARCVNLTYYAFIWKVDLNLLDKSIQWASSSNDDLEINTQPWLESTTNTVSSRFSSRFVSSHQQINLPSKLASFLRFILQFNASWLDVFCHLSNVCMTMFSAASIAICLTATNVKNKPRQLWRKKLSLEFPRERSQSRWCFELDSRLDHSPSGVIGKQDAVFSQSSSCRQWLFFYDVSSGIPFMAPSEIPNSRLPTSITRSCCEIFRRFSRATWIQITRNKFLLSTFN